MSDALQAGGRLEAEGSRPSGSGSPATTGKTRGTTSIRVTTAGQLPDKWIVILYIIEELSVCLCVCLSFEAQQQVSY